MLSCEANLAVNKHGTAACGECHVVGLGNAEPLPGYYDSGPLRMRWLLVFGLCFKENV